MLGKNSSFGWLFALIALIFCNEKSLRTQWRMFAAEFDFCTARRGCNFALARKRSENADKLRFYAVARCAANQNRSIGEPCYQGKSMG
jgi:hypothetical protein